MEFEKITSDDIQNKGVIGLPDTPNLSTADMQTKMEELTTDVVIPKFNSLVDGLNEMKLGERVASGDITNIKLDADKNLQVSTDGGETYSGTGSSGHIIENGAGTEFPARSRLQFSDNVKISDDTEGNKTFISVPSGEKGDKGDAATVQVGSVTVGETAGVENVGSDTDAIFNFVIPEGEKGDAATIQVGTVSKGTNPSVSNRGTSTNAILDFVLPKGDKGDDGTSFTILDVYETYEEFIAIHPTGAKGQAYLIGTTDDNNVYIWSATEGAWINAGPLKGNKGDKGDAGTISVGTVTVSENPFVENVGTSEEAVLNFGLPKGDKGDTGTAATVSIGNVSSGSKAAVTNSGTATNAVLNFTLPKGDKGDAGTPTTVNGKSGESIDLGAADIKMSGYTKATEKQSISAEDTVLAAVSKLEYKADNSEVDVLDTSEEIKANTDAGKVAGALGVKEMFDEVNNSLTADDGQNFKFSFDAESGKYGCMVKEAGTDVFVPFSSGGAMLTTPIYTQSFGGTSSSTWSDHPTYYDISNDCHVDYYVEDIATSSKAKHFIAVSINDEIIESCDGNSVLEGTLSLKAGDRFRIKAYSTSSDRCYTSGTLTFY